MYSGPHIKKDGLVFGYDTGQFSESNPNFDKFKPHKNEGRGAGRFFKGKPITNFIAYQNAVAQSSYTSYSATSSGTWNAKHPNAIRAYNAQGGDITGYINSGVTDWTNTYHAHWQFDEILKKPVVVMDCFDSNWKAKSFDCNTAAWSTYGMTTGSKYVISWLQWTSNTNKYLSAGIYSKNTSGTRNFYDGRSGNEASVKNTKPFTWQRVYKVYTVASTHDVTQDYQRIYMYGQYGTNGVGVTVKIADVQLELNTDHPTAFLNSISSDSKTSRSSTESILDLAKTTNIDVSNVSFDSNGLPTFDGTDDYIQVNNLGLSSHTMEGIIKSNNVSQGGGSGSTIVNAIGNYDGGSSKYTYIGFIPNLTFRIDNGASSHIDIATTSYSANTWYHVALTYNASDGVTVAYLNGVQIGSITSTANIIFDSIPFSIGKTVPNTYFNGEVPVVKVYNRAITPQEVKQNFRAYKNRFDI